MIRLRPMRPLSATLFLTLFAVSFAAAAAPLPAPHQVDIPAANLTLHAQLYKPEGDGPFPTVIALHSCGGPEGSHVIYSGSFSKVLAPGLRDAWVQAATPMISKLVQAKQGADLHTPTFNQMIISELVEEVMPAQIERVRALYGARAQTMMAQMKTHFPAGVSHTVPEGGMFLWVTLPESIDTAALLLRAVDRKVAFVPGAPFFALGGGHNTLRLSFSSANDGQIARGIQALGLTIAEALG